MAFYAMSLLGVAPFGSLLAGALAERIGAPATVIVGGALCLAEAIWFARLLPRLRKTIRPIYVDLGILPELAEGLQSATALQTPPE